MEAAEEFQEIMDSIKEKVQRALQLVKHQCDRIEYERAKAYWFAHIVMAIDNDHEYLGKNMGTMADSLEAIADRECQDSSDDE